MNIRPEIRQRFAAMKSEVLTYKDKLGMPVDDEIVDIVAALRLRGFNTFASCAGHLDRDSGGPYVMFESSDVRRVETEYKSLTDKSNAKSRELRSKLNMAAAQENIKLFTLLRDFYKQHTIDYEKCLTVRQVGYAGGRLEINTSSYFCLLDSSQRIEWLKSARGEMDEFCHFILS